MFLKIIVTLAWWLTYATLALEGMEQEDCRESEGCLGYTVRSRPARGTEHDLSPNNDSEFEANQSYIMRICLE